MQDAQYVPPFAASFILHPLSLEFAIAAFFCVNQVNFYSILELKQCPTVWMQRPDMTLSVDWDVKHKFKQTNEHVFVPLV